MNKYLTEGLEKFLKNQEEKKEVKKPVKNLKESVEKEVLTKEDIDKFFTDCDKKIRKVIESKVKDGYTNRSIYTNIDDELFDFNPKGITPEIEKYFNKRVQQIINEYKDTNYTEIKEDEEASVKDYLPAGKDIMKFFVAGTMREKIKAAKEVLTAMRDEIMDIGAPDEPNFYKEDENIKEFIFDMQDNTGEFGHLLGDDEEDLDESCNKQLKEETNMDKINKYLVSIGEAPIIESIKEDTKVKKAIDDKKSAPSNYDKIVKTLGESKKSVKRSTNLMESLNSGFVKIYGDFDDSKSLMESKGNKKESLKEYKDMGQDLGEYQKWVDYDMKKYHKISDNTMSKIKKAGLSVVKDQYGQYEVIAKEADKDSDKDSKK